MMIFDSFPSPQQAADFARDIESRFRLTSQAFLSQEESNKYDAFPFRLNPPIVLVERPNIDDREHFEQLIEKSAQKFHGKFAGT